MSFEIVRIPAHTGPAYILSINQNQTLLRLARERHDGEIRHGIFFDPAAGLRIADAIADAVEWIEASR